MVMKRARGFQVCLGVMCAACALLASADVFAEQNCTSIEPVPFSLQDSLLRARLGAESAPTSFKFDENTQDGTSRRMFSRFRLRFDYKQYNASSERSTEIKGESDDTSHCGTPQDVMPRLMVRAEADVFSGVVVGDVSPQIPARAHTGTQLDRQAWDGLGAALDPRELSVGYTTPIGLLKAGLQTSQFGLGVLANSGDEDGEKLLFDRQQGGDRVWRLLFVTKPFSSQGNALADVYTALGGDLVWRDDFASWLDGDRAYQVIGSIFYQTEEAFAGVYAARRRQYDADGSRLDVTAFDGSFKLPFFSEHPTLDAHLAVEGVVLAGETDRVYPYDESDTMGVLGRGMAIEFHGYHNKTMLGTHILAGGASGDGNPDDGTLYRLRFDPNYNVGLILFDQFLPAVTRAYHQRAIAPEQQGEPPRGAENLINDGAIENAYYLNPRLSLGRENEGALLGLGALVAWSPQPWFDPYSTFAQGGEPVGIQGNTTELNDLGWEVDASLQYRASLLSGRLFMAVRGEAGVFVPGKAFRSVVDEQLSERYSLFRGRIDFEW